MATVTINIPDAVAPRVVNAFVVKYGYAATQPDGTPNPESKQQFVKRQLIEHIKGIVKEVEATVALQRAVEDAKSDVDTSINMT